RGDLASVEIGGEMQAGPGRLAIDHHGAGTANAVLAADMGAFQANLVTKEVSEEETRLDQFDMMPAIDPEGDLDLVCHCLILLSCLASSRASRRACATSTPARLRR